MSIEPRTASTWGRGAGGGRVGRGGRGVGRGGRVGRDFDHVFRTLSANTVRDSWYHGPLLENYCPQLLRLETERVRREKKTSKKKQSRKRWRTVNRKTRIITHLYLQFWLRLGDFIDVTKDMWRSAKVGPILILTWVSEGVWNRQITSRINMKMHPSTEGLI